MTTEKSEQWGDIDWGLALIVIVASQGFSKFIPGDSVQVTLFATSIVMVAYLVRQPGRTLEMLFTSPLVFFFAAWSMVAALISPRPAVALSLSLGPVLTIVYAGVRRLNFERLVKTFSVATTVAMLPSAIGLVTPILGPVKHDAGAAAGYAGYFGWNSAAGLCAAVALLCFALMGLKREFAWWHLPAAGMAALLLQQSKSATAILASASVAAVAAGQILYRRSDPHWRVLAVASIAVAGIFLAPKAISYLSDLTWLSDLTDRSRSLSGRTTIWQWAWEGITQSPLWGHGVEFWKSVGAWNRSGHNGFIDIALKSGLPAAFAFAAILIVAALRLRDSSLLLFMTFGVVANLAVSNLSVTSIPSLAVLLPIGIALHRAIPPTAAENVPNLAKSRVRSLASP